jgi:hypothetical protein
MPFCEECGASVEPALQSCPKCGAQQSASESYVPPSRSLVQPASLASPPSATETLSATRAEPSQTRFCTECGAANALEVAFCTGCGARLVPFSQGTLVGAGSGFSTGEIMVLCGAGLAVASFFLPLVSAAALFGGLGRVVAPESITGIGLFKLAGAWVLLAPALAALAGAFVFLFRDASTATRLHASGWQIVFGAVPASSVLSIFFVPMLPSVLSVGYYGLALGYVAVVAGAFCLLNELAQRREEVAGAGRSGVCR